MKNYRLDKLKISNYLFDAMLIGVKTQENSWGKEGIITQLNKTILMKTKRALGSYESALKLIRIAVM